MSFDISVWQLALWSAVSSIIVLVTAEFISPYYGKLRLAANPARMRLVGMGLGAVFFVCISIHLSSVIK